MMMMMNIFEVSITDVEIHIFGENQVLLKKLKIILKYWRYL